MKRPFEKIEGVSFYTEPKQLPNGEQGWYGAVRQNQPDNPACLIGTTETYASRKRAMLAAIAEFYGNVAMDEEGSLPPVASKAETVGDFYRDCLVDSLKEAYYRASVMLSHEQNSTERNALKNRVITIGGLLRSYGVSHEELDDLEKGRGKETGDE